MLHNFKKPLGIGAVVAGLGIAGIAYAASSLSEATLPVRAAGTSTSTVSWALGGKTFAGESATYNNEVFASAAVTLGSGVTSVGGRTAKPSAELNIPLSTAKNLPQGKDDNYYVDFTVTPAVEFTPTEVSLQAWGVKFGGGAFAAELICDGQTYVITEQQKVARTQEDSSNANEAKDGYTFTFQVDGAEATTSSVTLRVYPYTTDTSSTRELGIANVSISGAISGEGGGEEPGPGEEPEIPAGWTAIPGALPVTGTGDGWSYSGSIKYEGEEKGVGYIKDGSVSMKDFYCAEEGVYRMDWNIYSTNNGGYVTLTVTDKESGKTEASSKWFVSAKGDASQLIEGTITKGKKTLKLEFSNDGGYLFNYKTPTFVKVAEAFACVSGVNVEGAEAVDAGEGVDWAFNLPEAYSQATTTIKVDYAGGTLAATCNDEALEVGADGTIALATPAASREAVVNLTLAPAEGAIAPKTEYAVRVFHIGDVMVRSVSVDGVSLDADAANTLNGETGTYTLEGNIYTSVPEVTLTFVDGSEATAAGVLDGTTATYSITGESADKSKTFTIVVEGVHVYTATEADKTGEMKSNGGSKNDDGLWSNGVFTMTNNPDGYNESFKLGMKEYTIGMPANYVVKQLVFHNICSNYTNSRVRMESVVSEGATVYVPSTFSCVHSSEATPGNLIVNLEGHRAGTPITFKAAGGSQYLFWLEVVYEEVVPTTAPAVTETKQTSTEHTNHAVVSLTFDRMMAGGKATVNGRTVEAEGGSTVLSFPVWNLSWNETNILAIAAGDAEDAYGNVTDTRIEVSIEVGSPAEVTLDNVIVVSTVAEWKAALAEVNETNKSADAAPAVIYVLNGDYDFGSEEQTFACHNVSIIGESRDGVLLHGNRTGISNPVISTRKASNTYMQDLTIRNDYDYPVVSVTHNKEDRKGVSVAHYGGTKEVMKNVTLQAIQDTQVTGNQGYYVNCRIEGNTDFICGGGDHYFDHCEIVMIVPGVITAPSTSPSNKYGYVFQHCTISGDAGYTLGRPWQNEPRAFFLNTIMEALPATSGWSGMSTLPTYMYEYNSMDASGNVLSLASRVCSPTSTNKYTPVLPEQYAEHFTIENVLGSSDSWLPTEDTETVAAPSGNKIDNVIGWEPVEGAAGYILYRGGRYVGHTTECSIELPLSRTGETEGEYTLRAMNRRGGVGLESDPIKTTGVDAVEAAGTDGAEYYNLQGVRVNADTRGILIRVDAQGATKVVNE